MLHQRDHVASGVAATAIEYALPHVDRKAVLSAAERTRSGALIPATQPNPPRVDHITDWCAPGSFDLGGGPSVGVSG